MMPEGSKIPFRVGLNEGVVIEHEKLGELDLYTDGLAGCVALVVANERYVFMAHVSSGSDARTVERRASQYLHGIISHIGGGEIQVQIGLGGDMDAGIDVVSAFVEACKKEGQSFVSSHGGSCRVEFINQEMQLNASRVAYRPYDIMGTLKRPDLVVGRINADGYGFGEEVLAGDYDEALDYAVKKDEWKDTPALLRAASSLVRAVSAGGGLPDYKYGSSLLGEIDERIVLTGKAVTAENRVEICNRLVDQIESLPQNEEWNSVEAITTIVADVARQQPALSISRHAPPAPSPLPRLSSVSDNPAASPSQKWMRPQHNYVPVPKPPRPDPPGEGGVPSTNSPSLK